MCELGTPALPCKKTTPIELSFGRGRIVNWQGGQVRMSGRLRLATLRADLIWRLRQKCLHPVRALVPLFSARMAVKKSATARWQECATWCKVLDRESTANSSLAAMLFLPVHQPLLGHSSSSHLKGVR